MHLLLAAQSGWGKSGKAQHVIERNLPEFEHVVVLDYKDEYRGLVKGDLARWWIAGPRERAWSRSTWHDFLVANQRLVLARYDRMTTEAWREVAADVIAAARRLGDVLIVVDEAHFVAPQTAKVPDPITGLATTGGGEGASSVWITQRLSEAEETVLAQCQQRLLGGFESDADLSKVGGIVEYSPDLHNPATRELRVPVDLEPAGRETPVGLQKHTDDDGHLTGSEWVYSDNSGDRERLDTTGMMEEMRTEHYGRERQAVKVR